MAKIIRKNFNIHSAKQFIEAIDEPANTILYIGYGKHTPFADDAVPDIPVDAESNGHFDIYRNLIGGKQLTSSDLKSMTKRYNWTANTVYTMYDDRKNITDTQYFVVNQENTEYNVFLCLDNNSNSASISAPLLSETTANDSIYVKTVDGYQWKYLYTISTSNFSKFATDQFIPVIPNADVSGNANPGSIQTIVVDTSGENYNARANGNISQASIGGNNLIFAIESQTDVLSANTDFYKGSAFYINSGTGIGQLRTVSEYVVSGDVRRVVVNQPFNVIPDLTSQFVISPSVSVYGDGTGAEARALVNTSTNAVSNIHMVNVGTNYTWANAVVVGNTGIVNAVSNSIITSNTASIRPIISPKDGHGSDVVKELDAHFVCITTTQSNTENGILSTENDFRQISLIKDPKFANVIINITTSVGTTTVGETLSGDSSNAFGIVVGSNTSQISLTNAIGIFTSSETVRGLTSNNTGIVTSVIQPTTVFDQRHKYTSNVITTGSGSDHGGFIIDETVTQSPNTALVANADLFSINSTSISVTNQLGIVNVSDVDDLNTFEGISSGAVASLSAVSTPDLVNGSGEILYIENVVPVSRSNTQSETFKLIIEF